MNNWTESNANLPVFLNGSRETRVRTNGVLWQVFTTMNFPLPIGSVEEYLAEIKERTMGLQDTDLDFFGGNDAYNAEATVSGWRDATAEEEEILNAK